MQSRWIGDVEVGMVGLGTADMAMIAGRVDEQEAVRTIHAALDAGVTLIDTADTYAPRPDAVGHGERLVAKALASSPGDASAVLVATKFGHTRTREGGWLLDGRPEHVRRACDASLGALGVEAIGLYQYHRPDPRVPYQETIHALRECGTLARSAWSALPMPICSRSRWRGRCSATAASPRCRTSSRPGIGRASPSCGTAPSTASHSYRGVRSAGFGARAGSPHASPRSG
jgi:aldo/keto reductase family protein